MHELYSKGETVVLRQDYKDPSTGYVRLRVGTTGTVARTQEHWEHPVELSGITDGQFYRREETVPHHLLGRVGEPEPAPVALSAPELLTVGGLDIQLVSADLRLSDAGGRDLYIPKHNGASLAYAVLKQAGVPVSVHGSSVTFLVDPEFIESCEAPDEATLQLAMSLARLHGHRDAFAELPPEYRNDALDEARQLVRDGWIKQ